MLSASQNSQVPPAYPKVDPRRKIASTVACTHQTPGWRRVRQFCCSRRSGIAFTVSSALSLSVTIAGRYCHFPLFFSRLPRSSFRFKSHGRRANCSPTSNITTTTTTTKSAMAHTTRLCTAELQTRNHLGTQECALARLLGDCP
jgi:hypothetical protein